MKSWHRLVSISAIIAMLASIGILTGHQAVAAPAKASSVTINLTGWASTPSEPTNLKKVLKAFNKKFPNIHVNYQIINGDLETQIKTRLVAGTAPDVFYVDEGWAQSFEATGQLMPLNSFYAKDPAFNVGDFYKGLLAGFTRKGKVYGFPKDYSTLAMWYNKSMFAAAGISKPPTTWAQFSADAKKLTIPSKNQYGAALANDPARWLPFVQGAGGALLNKAQTKATIDSAAGKTALDFWAGLVKDGYAKEPSQVGAGWSGEAFGKANAAMVFEGNWLTAPMHDSWPSISWGIAPLPKGPKSSGNLAFSVAYSMWAKTKHPKEAWDLLSYLTGKEGMGLWVKYGKYLPGRKSIKAPPGTKAFVQGAKYARPWSWPEGFDKALTAISNDLDKAMKGELSTSAALSDMQSQSNQVLSGAP